jgi:hypothetical protein
VDAAVDAAAAHTALGGKLLWRDGEFRQGLEFVWLAFGGGFFLFSFDSCFCFASNSYLEMAPSATAIMPKRLLRNSQLVV